MTKKKRKRRKMVTIMIKKDPDKRKVKVLKMEAIGKRKGKKEDAVNLNIQSLSGLGEILLKE